MYVITAFVYNAVKSPCHVELYFIPVIQAFFTAMVISKHLIIIIIIIIIVIIIVIIINIIINSPSLLRICSFIAQGNRG